MDNPLDARHTPGSERNQPGGHYRSHMDPSDFYTGIVPDVYTALRASHFDATRYREFVREHGEPALELGCGDDGPFFALVADGTDVEGIDSSADMVARGQRRLEAEGRDARIHHQRMEQLSLNRSFASIYLAGPTFNLLPDDATAAKALEAIARHLQPTGAALVPLWTPHPTPTDQIGVVNSTIIGESTAQYTVLSEDFDEAARTRTTVLRYELNSAGVHTVEDREWIIHWYSDDDFRQLASAAGLDVEFTRICDDQVEAVLQRTESGF